MYIPISTPANPITRLVKYANIMMTISFTNVLIVYVYVYRGATSLIQYDKILYKCIK